MPISQRETIIDRPAREDGPQARHPQHRHPQGTVVRTLGKPSKVCGESNVPWGTDSIWYGSPQGHIQACRAFQNAPELRERYGYAELTPALRAKFLGLNALRVYPVPDDVRQAHLSGDRVARQRAEYRQQPDPTFVTYGPKTQREFLNLLAWDGS